VPAQTAGRTLPFSGANPLPQALGGLSLLLVGAVLRRRTARREQ
jgi:hypothetical protein